ncbi:hemerythrin [Desulfonispora thiosulfatigenes DSM 11270]|uniref:Hemerythrin n=1 Tax=Desulfonispora thiosulfatigenes DSM 11270 TaxID=656914 RepID=A0A1W1VFP5_DESTI|nr:bacteriohemerythrin [Desulfonispora thiosulfatigenes]SMB92033.1 hemerythrin [Desulfonispora thiosulfatigenes DSM 11270]
MIKWREEYSTGVQSIDEQHKKLIEIADRAFKLLKDDFCVDKYDKIVSILEELKDYTVYHFQSEEEYMMSIRYKKLFSHKALHEKFIEKINEVDFNKIDEDQNEYILGILEFIVTWIENHILGNDKLIGKD